MLFIITFLINVDTPSSLKIYVVKKAILIDDKMLFKSVYFRSTCRLEKV